VHGSDKLVKQYGKMALDEAYARVRDSLKIEGNISKESPLRRLELTHFKREKSKNLVIFIQESLGYQFVEAVGGEKGLTPNFNRLAKEGILFRDLYSNGTRSVRGLAGMSAGNFSVPGKGVTKRNKSQTDYFTIAKLLKPYGYKSLFIYGGESRFDNMKGWYLGNGFDEVIDQEKFQNPQYTGTWGVCDEEVTQRANKEFKKMYADGQKFVTVMFSTSNHSPYDFPDGKFKLVEGVAKKSVKNAVKYADYSIGSFIDNAKKEAYYKDTVFVVVADHNIRVYGDDLVPVSMFHIPGLILSQGIDPLLYEKVASQPDVLATALDLLGLDLNYPIMGKSIFSDKKNDLVLMQYYNAYALRIKDKIAIVRPNKEPLTFLYKDEKLRPIAHDKELENNALAFVVVLNDMYQKKLYK
jgi:phosphoglycerol transferase MdoB-like AlkP superfamily enzyme